MKPDEELIISVTTDPSIMKFCAQRMSSSDPWITLQMNYDQCLQSFEGPWREIYIVHYENKIAGFVILQVFGTFKGYIQTLYIDGPYQGRGFGKKVLQFCEERILKISPNIFICVSAFNQGAIKLYYEFGFTLVGELENFVREGFNELLLRKTYGPLIGYTYDAGYGK